MTYFMLAYSTDHPLCSGLQRAASGESEYQQAPSSREIFFFALTTVSFSTACMCGNGRQPPDYIASEFTANGRFGDVLNPV